MALFAGGAAVEGAFNLANTTLSNALAAGREALARSENYRYGEMSADSADSRTRALYSDLYSPQAQMAQIKAAGLSPSTMYADGGGISGQAGAQGTGAAGVNPTVFGLNPMMLADIKLKEAEAKNLEANTKKTNEETTAVQLKNEIQSLDNQKYGINFTLSTVALKVGDETKSLYEIAGDCSSYENFIKRVETAAQNTGDNKVINGIHSEYGQQTLRGIYLAREEFARNIAVLSEEGISADFQQSIVNALKNNNFAETNAKAAIAQFNAAIATNDLTESQKKAYNNIIKALENKENPSMSDLAILFTMILTQGNMPKVNVKL